MLGTFAITALLMGAYHLMFGEEDELIKQVNKLLAGKGYVKNYDRKKRIYAIELNVGSCFSDLERLKGVFENLFKTEVEIINDHFSYFVKLVDKKEVPSLVPFRITDTTQFEGMKVAVAVGADGPVYLDFTKVPHTLVAGATGWGKSIFIKNLILQIVSNYPNVNFEFFDFKSGIELGDFKCLKQTNSFTVRPDQAEKEIRRIYEEIEDRFATITSSNSRDWIAYNKRSRDKMTPKFVIIEEFTILLNQSNEMSITLTKCLAIARAVAVFFVFTSQRFDSKIIDSKIKANIDNRVCFHTADAINSKLILDVCGAETLNVVGRCLVSTAGKIEEGQTPFVKEDDVKTITERHRMARSELSEDEVINNSQKTKTPSKGQKRANNEEVIIWG